jgi:hypothetical protein
LCCTMSGHRTYLRHSDSHEGSAGTGIT